VLLRNLRINLVALIHGHPADTGLDHMLDKGMKGLNYAQT